MRPKGWMELDAILEAMQPPPGPPRRGAHSPTYEGLWAWYDQLVPHLDPPRRPDWQWIAGKLAAKGFTTAPDARHPEGQPISKERLYKDWWKVRRDKERQAAGVTRKPRGQKPKEATSGRSETPAATVPPVKKAGASDPGDDGFGLTFAGGPREWKGDEE